MSSVTGAVTCTAISLVIAGIFLMVTLSDDYSWVARLGGAGWVFLLSMIVLMPVVIPGLKKGTDRREV